MGMELILGKGGWGRGEGRGGSEGVLLFCFYFSLFYFDFVGNKLN